MGSKKCSIWIIDREIYMQGMDTSYYYEGYTVYRVEEL